MPKPPVVESSVCELTPDALYHRCDPEIFGFETTEDLGGDEEQLGQERALEALEFGVGVKHEGYNLFLMGPPGIGRHTALRAILEREGGDAPTPPDWCLLNNFDAPHRPKVLQLPAGTARHLQTQMRKLVRTLLIMLPAAYENDEYRSQVQQLNLQYKKREEKAFEKVGEEAEKHSILLLQTPMGYTLAPAHDGNVIEAAEFNKLSDEEKLELERASEEMRGQVGDVLRQVESWQKEHAQRLSELEDSVAERVARQLTEEVADGYRQQPGVLKFLAKVRQDIVERSEEIRKFAAESKRVPTDGENLAPFSRYDLNVLVDNGDVKGAPIVDEDHPTYQNLFGRIDHIAQFGTLKTNFTLIKGGALHRANGGHLILDARKLLMQPFAWDALKRALFAREVKIESVERMLSLGSTVTLEPEPIPLQLKVSLIGERMLYYLLSAYDPDFPRLFKVSADFAEDVPRDPASIRLYAGLVAAQLRREKLLPATPGAVARLIEEASRQAQDAQKLSLSTERLLDLEREADYWTRQAGKQVTGREHVEQAIQARIRRIDRVRERMHEAVLEGLRVITTEGEQVAQINGLAVLQLAGFAFGMPTRISATARFGEGGVVDIEREVDLGEAIHSKGVLILSSYLAQRYARDRPLSLSASLVFEQSYGSVDGDSASVAELCVLVSALANLPLRQDLAVTGSINQQGGVQAIGGVNEKIEGFFDICQARGLSGTQGVVIPAANQRHLMLRKDVVEAVEQGRFAVYTAGHVDEVIALFTGQPAGKADEQGVFEDGSVNARVAGRIAELASLRQSFAKSGESEESA